MVYLHLEDFHGRIVAKADDRRVLQLHTAQSLGPDVPHQLHLIGRRDARRDFQLEDGIVRDFHVQPADEDLRGSALHEAVDLRHVGNAALVEVAGQHLLVEALGLPGAVGLHDLLGGYAHDMHDVAVEVVPGVQAGHQDVAPRIRTG